MRPILKQQNERVVGERPESKEKKNFGGVKRFYLKRKKNCEIEKPNTTDCVSLSVADTGLVWGPNIHLGDFSETAQNSLTPNSTLPPTPASLAASAAAAAAATSRSANSTPAGSGSNTVPRLKRLNNAQQHNVYTLCQTAEGAMKFRCTECSRCFNLKCTLLRHVRHQHQGRFVPHPCGQCGQVFKRTDHLKVHMRKIHKMTSASRSNRGGGGANNSRVSLGPGPEMGNVSADAISVSSQSALVAAAVASMANTQPLALTTKSEESDGERK